MFIFKDDIDIDIIKAIVINAINTAYIAEYDASGGVGSNGIIYITGICKNQDIDLRINSAKPSRSDIIIEELCGGKCSTNCISEKQAQEISNKIQKLTKLCFQYLGFNYQSN